jgi:hypothetical protein
MLLLGEALALNGDTERAGAIWKNLHADQDQIWLRWAWHDAIGDKEGASLLEEAAADLSPREVGTAP